MTVFWVHVKDFFLEVFFICFLSVSFVVDVVVIFRLLSASSSHNCRRRSRTVECRPRRHSRRRRPPLRCCRCQQVRVSCTRIDTPQNEKSLACTSSCRRSAARAASSSSAACAASPSSAARAASSSAIGDGFGVSSLLTLLLAVPVTALTRRPVCVCTRVCLCWCLYAVRSLVLLLWGATSVIQLCSVLSGCCCCCSGSRCLAARRRSPPGRLLFSLDSGGGGQCHEAHCSCAYSLIFSACLLAS